MSKPNLLWIALISATLAACGGGGDPVVASSDTEEDTTDSTDTDDTATTTAGSSYFPLQFLMSGSEYTDFDGYFSSVVTYPLIGGYVIAPVDGATLSPLETPKISDYTLTVNGEAVDPDEHGLMMQKIIGLPVSLKTALLVDTSGSITSQGIDKSSYINAVKTYISSAQSSSDPVIRDQEFTLWAYANAGDGVEPLVGTFTSDASTLNTALDGLLAANAWDDRGNYTATYEAIVKAVGTYNGSGSGNASVAVDLSSDAYDDLDDDYTYNAGFTQMTGLNVSSLVLFTAGPNTSQQTFWKEDALAALQWQSLLTYVEQADSENTDTQVEDDGAAGSSEMALVPKPLIYVSLGTGGADENISDLAATVIDTNSTNTFNVASQVIAAQQNAVSVRVRAGNQYLVRFAMSERDGKHEVVFSSDSGGYDYALTANWDLSDGSFLLVPQVSATAEITGPSNAYLPEGNISLSNLTRLYPATRWSAETFTASDYSWTVNGVTQTKNSDGSIDIDSGDIGHDVILTNDTLGVSSVTFTVVE